MNDGRDEKVLLHPNRFGEIEKRPNRLQQLRPIFRIHPSRQMAASSSWLMRENWTKVTSRKSSRENDFCKGIWKVTHPCIVRDISFSLVAITQKASSWVAPALFPLLILMLPTQSHWWSTCWIGPDRRDVNGCTNTSWFLKPLCWLVYPKSMSLPSSFSLSALKHKRQFIKKCSSKVWRSHFSRRVDLCCCCFQSCSPPAVSIVLPPSRQSPKKSSQNGKQKEEKFCIIINFSFRIRTTNNASSRNTKL